MRINFFHAERKFLQVESFMRIYTAIRIQNKSLGFIRSAKTFLKFTIFFLSINCVSSDSWRHLRKAWELHMWVQKKVLNCAKPKSSKQKLTFAKRKQNCNKMYIFLRSPKDVHRVFLHWCFTKNILSWLQNRLIFR